MANEYDVIFKENLEAFFCLFLHKLCKLILRKPKV